MLFDGVARLQATIFARPDFIIDRGRFRGGQFAVIEEPGADTLAVAIAGLVVVIAGFQLTTTLWAFDIPSLGLPRGLALLPLPLAGGLITLFSAAHLVESLLAPTEELE